MVDDQTFTTTETSGTVTRRRRTVLIVGIVILVVAIGAIVAGVVVSESSNNNSNTNNADGSRDVPTGTPVSPSTPEPASITTVAPTETPVTATNAPATETPVTTIPTTAPVTAAPTTSSPTAAPVSMAPILPGEIKPPSAAPVTLPPSAAPTTSAPITSIINPTVTVGTDSVAPVTEAPVGTLPSVTPGDLIRSVATFEGSEFLDPESYQSRALLWVESQEITGILPDERIIQRYALACIYYATNGVETIYTLAEFGEVDAEDLKWLLEEGWLSGDSECTWHGITCNQENFVTAIELADNLLTGSFPYESVLLKDHLIILNINNNVVYNEDDGGHAFLGELTNLQELEHTFNYFVYEGIPTVIASLTNLVKYDCAYTLYFGQLDGEVFKDLTNLNYINMGGNAYNSSLPTEIIHLPELEFLYVDNSFLEGDLEFITSMPKIFEIWLDINPDITGTIPENIGSASTLASISWSECSLAGTLPSSISQLTDLQLLWLYRNDFTGTIPPEFGNLSSLILFEVYDNLISGTMPESICSTVGAVDNYTLTSDCNTTVDCSCCTCCGSGCYLL